MTLHHGDALETLKTLPSASVQCCITSPPYWHVRDYGHRQWFGGDHECQHDQAIQHRVKCPTFEPGTWDRAQYRKLNGRWGRQHHSFAVTHECSRCGAWLGALGLEPSIDLYVQHLVEVFREVKRVLKKGGTAWLNMGDAIKNKRLQGVPWRLALALQDDGWYLRSDVVWHRPNGSPEAVKDRPHRAHEYLFLLSKSPKYHFDLDAVREPTHHRRSVWRIPIRRDSAAHCSVFPGELAKLCVLASTRPGDVVLDPFAGSGTTCATAAQLGREFIGVELDESHVRLIQERLASLA